MDICYSMAENKKFTATTLKLLRLGGDFAFASMYQDHMVLQMQPHSAVLWGYGAEGADVNVSFGEEDYPTKVLKTPAGIWAWKVTLKPHCAGGPHTITAYQINGTNTETRNITDVLFGDVWVCGGQSNMAMTVSMVSIICCKDSKTNAN